MKLGTRIMSLLKKFLLAVFLFLFAMFLVTSIVIFTNNKESLSRRLLIDTQQNASSLAMAVAPSFRTDNTTALPAILQSFFVRGGIERVEIFNNKDQLVISRQVSQTEHLAPRWFAQLISLPNVEKQAVIMSQQKQIGLLKLYGDREHIYTILWENAIWLLLIFSVFLLLALVASYYFIQSLLGPLKRLEQQAIAIHQHQFLVEETIPKTTELKNLTLAMNQMIGRLQTLFSDQLKQTELLRKQVYQDSLTGLYNRQYFLQQLQALLDNEDDFIPGYVIMLVVDGLDEYNQKQGYETGDQLILGLSNLCQSSWSGPTTSTIARSRGNTFAIIDHENDPAKFELKAKEFEQKLIEFFEDKPGCSFHLAATAYFFHQSANNFLALLDTAVKKASESGAYYSHMVQDNVIYPRLLLSEDILIAMENKNISLYWQPVTDTKRLLHHEIFARMEIHGYDEIGAGYFIPVAEQYEIAHLIDLYILLEVVKLLVNSHEKFALNLSKDTLVNEDFSELYLKQLRKIPEHMCELISVEINESVLVEHFSEVQAFIKKVRNLGVQVGIDRVGSHMKTLHHFSDLPINYIKLHGSLLQDIEGNDSKQFFIHYLMLMMKTLDIEVIGTQVEFESQWEALKSIGIVWGQGRYLGGVELLSVPQDVLLQRD